MTDREQFEAWARTMNMDLTPYEETFDSDFTSNAWDGWQARAAFLQPVAQTWALILPDEQRVTLANLAAHLEAGSSAIFSNAASGNYAKALRALLRTIGSAE